MRTKAAPRLFPFSCLLLPPPSSPFPLHEFPQLLPPILVELRSCGSGVHGRGAAVTPRVCGGCGVPLDVPLGAAHGFAVSRLGKFVRETAGTMMSKRASAALQHHGANGPRSLDPPALLAPRHETNKAYRAQTGSHSPEGARCGFRFAFIRGRQLRVRLPDGRRRFLIFMSPFDLFHRGRVGMLSRLVLCRFRSTATRSALESAKCLQLKKVRLKLVGRFADHLEARTWVDGLLRRFLSPSHWRKTKTIQNLQEIAAGAAHRQENPHHNKNNTQLRRARTAHLYGE